MFALSGHMYYDKTVFHNTFKMPKISKKKKDL